MNTDDEAKLRKLYDNTFNQTDWEMLCNFVCIINPTATESFIRKCANTAFDRFLYRAKAGFNLAGKCNNIHVRISEVYPGTIGCEILFCVIGGVEISES